MKRRDFLTTASGAGLLAALPGVALAEETFEVTHSKAEWKAMLTPLQYKVMREEGTERAFSSPLNDEKRNGIFHCRGCDLPLYDSAAKYDSGTGWPSFWQPIDDTAVGTKPDRSLFMTRTECHCSNCGSHLGHIFEDGPQPTGLRHCINGVSLSFVEA